MRATLPADRDARAAACPQPPPGSYEQYELERAQLREMMGRNKAEVEAMATSHAEEMEVRLAAFARGSGLGKRTPFASSRVAGPLAVSLPLPQTNCTAAPELFGKSCPGAFALRASPQAFTARAAAVEAQLRNKLQASDTKLQETSRRLAEAEVRSVV